MIVWFVAIAALGVLWITRMPSVLGAFDPRHAVSFFTANGFMGFAVLGAVFLVVTGGEALYADMGHFGRSPIRLAWFALVLPSLVLNYLGQGALLLVNPAVEHPFFELAPSWALWPLIVIATAAAIIASQALISGSFSITRQAVQLGLAPRLEVEHTSAREMGQVYVPRVNWALMVSTVAIVIGFGSSSAMAAAYGIAVTLTMIITVLLLFIVETERWQWPMPLAAIAMALFLIIDLAFFGANALKIVQGGWLPLAVAAVLFTLMTTWRTGRQIVAERLASRSVSLEDFFKLVDTMQPARVPGTAVYMTAQGSGTPLALVHNLQYNKVLHERVVILNVVTVRQPHCTDEERFAVDVLSHGLFNVRLQYGFMEDPHVPRGLIAAARSLGMKFDFQDVVVLPRPGDNLCHQSPRHGAVARETVCADVAQRGPRHHLFPPAARARRRARRPGRDVAAPASQNRESSVRTIPIINSCCLRLRPLGLDALDRHRRIPPPGPRDSSTRCSSSHQRVRPP